MRLQSLVIIFLALALPVIIILSFYVELSVDTVLLRTKYDDSLSRAAHETVIAYQINTNNDEFLTVADTKIRDIEASLNIFSSSLATSFGATGSSRRNVMAYVPALVFTLYDGYYIYTPTKSWETGTFTHTLKPYVHYSKQYSNESGTKTLSINYSLDNYVAIYYDNDVTNQESYVSKAGYLEVIPKNEIEETEFLNSLSDDTARKYYKDAWEFTKWFNEDILDSINTGETKKLKINENNSPLPGESSEFNSEKTDVIKTTITNNLIQAMNVYSKNSEYDFRMPELTGNDWDLILNNVCFIAFMQGIPVGTSTYNDYVIVTSSENREIANENLIYYVNKDSAGNVVGSYHRIWCPNLIGNDDNLSIIRI